MGCCEVIWGKQVIDSPNILYAQGSYSNLINLRALTYTAACHRTRVIYNFLPLKHVPLDFPRGLSTTLFRNKHLDKDKKTHVQTNR